MDMAGQRREFGMSDAIIKLDEEKLLRLYGGKASPNFGIKVGEIMKIKLDASK
jgi:hypothetical protein